MSARRLGLAVALALTMAGCVGLAAAWRPTDFIADHKAKVDLQAIVPAEFGDWRIDRSIVPVQPSPDLQKVIDQTYDQTLARTYRNAKGQRVMLSMAYGRNQHEGMNTHRPEICYPAQGFPIEVGGRAGILDANGLQIPVTRLVARKGERNEPITYWLIVGDRITTFGRNHKLLTLEYGLKKQIPDGILFRVSSIDRNDEHAFALQQAFVAAMLEGMSADHRRQLLGRMVPPS